jgi:flavin-dependent dehydrogenase
VALVERSRFDSPRVGESLAPAVQPLLCELGVWAEFRALKPLPSYGTRSNWGEATPRVHSHIMNPWGCGWHVDRLAFDLMLVQAAHQAGAIPFPCTTLVQCHESSSGWLLKLREHLDDQSSGRELELRSRVVIDATGRTARLASKLGAQRLLLDRLVGVAARFDGFDVSREGYVLVETAADGWWYSAPLPSGGMVVMLMTDSDLCGRFRFATSPIWLARLETAAATQARVAAGRRLWGSRVFSAFSQRLRRSERSSNWFAVGDSALAVDPISGSGIVRALRSARAGAETALALLEHHEPNPIEAYEAKCDRECTDYLNERAMYYAFERRWQECPFWARRDVNFRRRSDDTAVDTSGPAKVLRGREWSHLAIA